VKVIITNGYSNKGLVSDSINHGAKDFVIKTFNKVEISKSIKTDNVDPGRESHDRKEMKILITFFLNNSSKLIDIL